MAQEEFLKTGKRYIDLNDNTHFDQLVNSYIELSHERGYHNFPLLYKDLFIHMCLRGRFTMLQNFYAYFEHLSLLDQIALKSMFPYCLTLARKRKYKNIISWLDNIRIKNI
jgi:hypothetical protein